MGLKDAFKVSPWTLNPQRLCTPAKEAGAALSPEGGFEPQAGTTVRTRVSLA